MKFQVSKFTQSNNINEELTIYKKRRNSVNQVAICPFFFLGWDLLVLEDLRMNYGKICGEKKMAINHIEIYAHKCNLWDFLTFLHQAHFWRQKRWWSLRNENLRFLLATQLCWRFQFSFFEISYLPLKSLFSVHLRLHFAENLATKTGTKKWYCVCSIFREIGESYKGIDFVWQKKH